VGHLILFMALVAVTASIFNLFCYARILRDCPGWGAGLLFLVSVVTFVFGAYFVIIWAVMYAQYAVPMWLRTTARLWALGLLTGTSLLQTYLLVSRPKRNRIKKGSW
jgi:hypothetical protein